MNMTVPVVNMNGNSKESLVKHAMDIHHALEAAQKLIAESDLAHGRNFQTLADPKFQFRAREEKTRDFRVLEAMSREYLDLAIAIHEQGKEIKSVRDIKSVRFTPESLMGPLISDSTEST